MLKRKYVKKNEMKAIILAMREEGKSLRCIALKLGLEKK